MKKLLADLLIMIAFVLVVGVIIYPLINIGGNLTREIPVGAKVVANQDVELVMTDYWTCLWHDGDAAFVWDKKDGSYLIHDLSGHGCDGWTDRRDKILYQP